MNKYYTPTIEEFHIGFEYEIQHNENAQWGTTTFSYFEGEYPDYDSTQMVVWELENDTIRVKYLDKEDIESLGFKQSKSDINWYDYKNERYWLYKEDVNDWRWIISDEQSEVSFAGNIKNKSELKKLLKQLNVN